MARAMWSGSVGFGLVNVPVKAYTAVSDKDVSFNQIHAPCGSRITMKRFCAHENVEIPFEQIVKGFEVAKGQYVTVTAEELAAVDPKGEKCIDIEEFVALSDIDPIFFDATYYLAPDKGAGKAYALLLAGLRKTGKAGIARFTLRSKQKLACVRVIGNLIAVSTMNYADEIVARDELESALPAPSDREMDLVAKLIEGQSAKWEPAKFHDTRRAKILALIEQKAEGRTVALPANEPDVAAPVDLAAALEASLAAPKKSTASPAPTSAAVVVALPAPEKAPAKKARAKKSA